MIKYIEFPLLGEDQDREFEDSFLHWSVEEGQVVKKHEVIATLDTDKATIELTAEYSGTIHINKRDETPYKKGDVIAHIETVNKYITTEIPRCGEYGKNLAWWAPDHVPEIIEILEKKNPDYEFHQFVTSPGNGGYREYAIMKYKY